MDNNNTLWVIIYSKFSPMCRKLLSVIEQSGVGTELQLQSLCVDDKNMRRRISGDKRFNIKYVPCLLGVNKLTGVAAQYDSDQAFEIVNSVIANQPNNQSEDRRAPEREHKQPSVTFTQLTQPSESPPPSIRAQVQKQAQARAEAHAEAQAHMKGGKTENTTSIEDLFDIQIDEEKETDLMPKRNPNKISVASVMASRESMDDPFKMPGVPTLDIIPKRTGSKISVADVMAEKDGI